MSKIPEAPEVDELVSLVLERSLSVTRIVYPNDTSIVYFLRSRHLGKWLKVEEDLFGRSVRLVTAEAMQAELDQARAAQETQEKGS